MFKRKSHKFVLTKRQKAHQIADDVEKRLIAAFPNAQIIIHQDPAGLNEHHPQWCYEKL